MKRSLLAMILSLMPWLVAAHDGPHTGPTDATFKVGKDGRVKVTENLVAGKRTVPTGTYVFAHRIEGERHVVTLTKVTQGEGATPVEISTRLVPADAEPRRTALLAVEVGRTLELTTVEIAGERGQHVMAPGE